jgi:choline O-acetyltransferase
MLTYLRRRISIDRCCSREKGQPLCMEQYYHLFSSYRQPGLDKDGSKDTSANLALKPEHVIIICKNQIYVLDLVVNFTRLNEEQIFEQLKRIKRQSEREEKTLMYFANMGYLTSLPRNEWCQVREDLVNESKLNLESLSQIERCICVICLDKKIDVESICTGGDLNHPFDDENEIDKSNVGKQTAKSLNEEINLTRVAFQMLHGCKTNSGNRWFDKTIQFIVSEDGCCGMCYENSPADAIVISELCQHIIRFM